MQVSEPEIDKAVAREVARRVDAEMKRQKIRGTAVAIRLGLSQPAISRRIRGEIPFDVEELAAIARLLDVPVSTFVDSVQPGAA